VRRASKVDSVQPEIVKQLRSCGVSVELLHRVGSACPDIICGWRGVNVILELKSEKTPVTKAQQEWHAKWAGQSAVVRSFTEAMEVICAVGKLQGVA
jgi:Holliday junction resolvase